MFHYYSFVTNATQSSLVSALLETYLVRNCNTKCHKDPITTVLLLVYILGVNRHNKANGQAEKF